MLCSPGQLSARGFWSLEISYYSVTSASLSQLRRRFHPKDWCLRQRAGSCPVSATERWFPASCGLCKPSCGLCKPFPVARGKKSVTELEILAVVWTMQHFRAYLHGHNVTVYTDHSAVKAVLGAPGSSGKHARWWSNVFKSGVKEVNIVYHPGKKTMGQIVCRVIPLLLQETSTLKWMPKCIKWQV